MSAPWRRHSPRQIEISNEIRQKVEIRDPMQVINRSGFDELLGHALNCGASDIDFLALQPAWTQCEGYRHPINNRVFTTADLRMLADLIFGGSASTILAQGKSVNTAYELKLSRDHSERFRVNIVQDDGDGGSGLQITMRHIPHNIPDLDGLNIEPALLPHLLPDQGLVNITGPTGSGKSTLMASILKAEILDEMSHRKIVTGEAPIEFLLRKLKGKTSLVSQMEIGRDITSMAAFVIEAMRRKPEIIVVGETRDVQTMSATNDAGNSGHVTYTSMHTKSVHETVRRAINFFPSEERDGAALDFIGNARVVVNQLLLPGVDGKRRAAREFLVFSPELREEIAETPIALWPNRLRKATKEEGQPMAESIRKLIKNGEVIEEMIPQYLPLLRAA